MHKIEGSLRIKGVVNKKSESNRPLVSVITVVKNGERHLAQTIESVINQTYDNTEYIIIDGGSTDGTLSIIKGYEGRIDYWISEKDEGISDAFNKGINRSNGELIGILNSDDWYEEDTISKVVKVYLADRTIGVIHGDIRCYQDDKPLFVKFPHCNFQRIWRDMICNHPACFVARKIYEQFGPFDKSLKVAMDYELILRFYINKVEFYYINEVLTNIGYGGYSEKYTIKGHREVMQASSRYGYPMYKGIFWLSIKVLKRLITVSLGISPDSFLMRKYMSFSKRKAVIK